MRRPREDIDNYVEEVLSKENDLSYSELKFVIEGERYLDYRRQRKKLPCEVYNSSLKRLENGKRIDRHLCEDRSKGRICYSLTESRLQEMEIKLRENRATYFLIIFSELYDASPQYPLNDGVIKYFLEEENIDLSVDKLVEMGRSGITTLYKPVQYIQVVKEEHNLVVSPKQNKWDLKYTKEEHYYYRIIGLSTSDLVEHRRSIRDRINKSSAPEQGKKTRIIDILKSCRIDKKNYHWFLVDEKINEKTISETFSILEKNNMIYVLGTRKGEPRYTLQDDLYELLNHCLGITEDILLMLEKWWEHNYPPDNDAKRWLELFYPHSQVLAMIGSYGKQRQHTSHNKIRLDRKTQELKREAEFALTRHKAQIEYKDAHFEEIINKYSGPLLTAFTQLTTNPLVFRNLLKHIKKMDSVHRQSIWE